MTTKNRLYAVCIELYGYDPMQCEIVRGMLESKGIDQQNIAETHDKTCHCLSVFVKDCAQAKTLKKMIGHLKINHASITVKMLCDEHWKTKWKKTFKPFMITPQIKIIPLSYKSATQRFSKYKIYLDTDVVFGSGAHPTTQCIAAFIEKKRGLFASFLDIGTGTGVLGLVAHVHGAQTIWAFDTSSEAVKTAQNNFCINNVKPDYLETIGCETFKKKHAFDFVAANLLTDDLIRMKRRILSYVKANKYLAVSGISSDNYKRFRSQFDCLPLRCLKIMQRDGWRAILYKRIAR